MAYRQDPLQPGPTVLPECVPATPTEDELGLFEAVDDVFGPAFQIRSHLEELGIFVDDPDAALWHHVVVPDAQRIDRKLLSVEPTLRTKVNPFHKTWRLTFQTVTVDFGTVAHDWFFDRNEGTCAMIETRQALREKRTARSGPGLLFKDAPATFWLQEGVDYWARLGEIDTAFLEVKNNPQGLRRDLSAFTFGKHFRLPLANHTQNRHELINREAA